MNLKYVPDYKNEAIIKDIITKLGLDYINSDQIKCVLSYKSSSKRVIARLHPSLRVFTYAFDSKPLYIIELISEKFNKLSEKDQIKVLIHELMHIPKTFSGAARDHSKMGNMSSNGKMSKYLNSNCKTVDNLLKEYYLKSGKDFKEQGLFERFSNLLR
ncbi:MAG: putative metallopeptidase [Candidatus Nanoarchaeia archaeon]